MWNPGDGWRRGRASSSAGAAGGRRQQCAGIGHCGGCGGEYEVAPRGPMVDGVKRERLREGRRLRTMGGGVGGGSFRPRWEVEIYGRRKGIVQYWLVSWWVS